MRSGVMAEMSAWASALLAHLEDHRSVPTFTVKNTCKEPFDTFSSLSACAWLSLPVELCLEGSASLSNLPRTRGGHGQELRRQSKSRRICGSGRIRSGSVLGDLTPCHDQAARSTTSLARATPQSHSQNVCKGGGGWETWSTMDRAE